MCAHFGFGKNLLNGQTIKATIALETLKKELGSDQITTIDSHGGVFSIPGICFQLMNAFSCCSNIVILPAYKGLRFFVPLCSTLNLLFNRRLFYIVIGGWLPVFLEKHGIIARQLKKFEGIFVETAGMKNALDERGYNNVFVMPNAKILPELRLNENTFCITPPYKLCIFSRIMKEKGIEIAIEAVKEANQLCGRNSFELDIYGQVWPSYTNRFEEILSSLPSFIRYKGMIPNDQSIQTIKEYTALLFLTFYEGEGFAGTLIDAMAAGVPVIASDWKFNQEIVSNQKTGLLLKKYDTHNVAKSLLWLQDNIDEWNKMKYNLLGRLKRNIRRFINII